MKKRKQYSDEFRYEAATMVTEQGRSFADVCESLGVGQTALRRWIQTNHTAGPSGSMSVGKGQSADQTRINELEKQVKTLRKERDVLKKWVYAESCGLIWAFLRL